MKLRAGLHPVSLRRLLEAMWMDGSPVTGNGTYSRLCGRSVSESPEGFKPYVPEVFDTKRARATGKCAADKHAERATKVRWQEKARMMRLRLLDVEVEAAELYDDFVGHERAYASEGLQANNGEDDDDAKMFWDNLPPPSSDDRFRHCANSPHDATHRNAKKSRLGDWGCNSVLEVAWDEVGRIHVTLIVGHASVGCC